MILTDILKVLYQPHKVFKQIVQNPKYLGAIIVLLLFVAAQVAFQYTQYSKVYYEQTSPEINKLGTWTENATLWRGNSGIAITTNYDDFINNAFYGNGSLQFAHSNSNNMSIALSGINQVDCGPTGFQNLSMRIKIVAPQASPEKVTLTLYSLSDANYFQYDLTSNFSNSSAISLWNNLTVPVGSGNWQNSGTPQWQNITALKFDFAFSASSNITVRMEGLFFRGVYETPIQTDSIGFLIYVLQLVFPQFLFEWLILTGLLYIVIKGLKGTLTWKPLFVAVGFALIVIVAQTLLSIAATAALPAHNYYPVELMTGVPGEAQAIANTLTSTTATYSTILVVLQLATYVWISAVNAIVVRTLIPEFSWSKSALASAVSLVVTIILLSLLIGV